MVSVYSKHFVFQQAANSKMFKFAVFLTDVPVGQPLLMRCLHQVSIHESPIIEQSQKHHFFLIFWERCEAGFIPKFSLLKKQQNRGKMNGLEFFFCLGDLNFPLTRGPEEAKFYESWFLNERNGGSSVGDVTIVLTTIRLNLGNTFISFWRCQFGLPDRIRDFIRTVRWCLNWSALRYNTKYAQSIAVLMFDLRFALFEASSSPSWSSSLWWG